MKTFISRNILSLFALAYGLTMWFSANLGPLSYFIMAYRNLSPLQTNLHLAKTLKKPSRDSSPSLLLRFFQSSSVIKCTVLHCPVAQEWPILVSVSNSQCKRLAVLWAVSSVAQNKRICCETDLGQMALFTWHWICKHRV